MQSICAFRTPPPYLNVFARRPQVILLDPMYDCYAPMAARAGAVVVPVKLNLEDWSIPRDALAAAFSPRTKLLLINTPHNPTGKVGDCMPQHFHDGCMAITTSYDGPWQRRCFRGVTYSMQQSCSGSTMPMRSWTRCMSTWSLRGHNMSPCAACRACKTAPSG